MLAVGDRQKERVNTQWYCQPWTTMYQCVSESCWFYLMLELFTTGEVSWMQFGRLETSKGTQPWEALDFTIHPMAPTEKDNKMAGLTLQPRHSRWTSLLLALCTVNWFILRLRSISTPHEMATPFCLQFTWNCSTKHSTATPRDSFPRGAGKLVLKS